MKSGNAAAALREVDALFEGGSPAPMILGQIRAAAGQLRPDARARRALSAVLDADLALEVLGAASRATCWSGSSWSCAAAVLRAAGRCERSRAAGAIRPWWP